MKGSLSVEGAIIVPIFIFIITVFLKAGIVLYQEIKDENEAYAATGICKVMDFYNCQLIGDVVNELK